jgi:deoxyribonuclease-4
MIYLGCHLSRAAGYAAMGKTALSIGANTFQFFTRNPRGGAVKPLDKADASALAQDAAGRPLGPVVAHAPYTVNPCSKDENTREFARRAMAEDLARLEYLPGNFYNFHPGSHVGQGTETGIAEICETLNAVLKPDRRPTVLLETMAGKGSEVGGRFEELRAILDGCPMNERMGVCLDTCHVSDAGYDIIGDLDGVLAEFDRVIGLDRLKAIHVNDSKNAPGSHKDRHEKIGEGMIGLAALRAVVHHPRLEGLPMILETPNELPGYAREIQILKEI